MPKSCVAGGCSKKNSDGVSLHKFPLTDSHRLALWNRFMKVRRADWVGPSEHSVLCSAHFLETDFAFSTQHTMGFYTKRQLKQDAVPSVHAPVVVSKKQVEQGKRSTDPSATPPKKPRSSSAAVKLSLRRVSHIFLIKSSFSQS